MYLVLLGHCIGRESMSNTLRTHIKRRRLQRWLRREARLLAREADGFDCPAVQIEARKLLGIADSIPSMA
jgi:hypothetical protein